MKIKCFGIARDIIASDQIEIQDNDILKSVGDLKKWINSEYPAIERLNDFMIAVNQEYAEDDQTIDSRDEIAIIPPVSGG